MDSRIYTPLLFTAGALVLSACAATSDAPTPPSDTPATINQPVPPAANDRFQPSLSLCPLTQVSNAPTPTDGLLILPYRQFASINGVQVAVAPVEKACLSSGFGPRNSSTHKGIDLHNASAVDVYAGAAGTVREKQYRNDYGNMIVIDHGDGVFTRYAHLESFANGVDVGDNVSLGAHIGVMGNTASYPIPRHLHYEVLTGTWGAQAGSFALTPVDLFARLSAN